MVPKGDKFGNSDISRIVRDETIAWFRQYL